MTVQTPQRSSSANAAADADQKRFATLRAAAALRGMALHRLDDGWLTTHAIWSRAGTADDIAAALRAAGARV